MSISTVFVGLCFTLLYTDCFAIVCNQGWNQFAFCETSITKCITVSTRWSDSQKQFSHKCGYNFTEKLPCDGSNLWTKLSPDDQAQVKVRLLRGSLSAEVEEMYCCESDNCNMDLHSTRYSYPSPSGLRCHHKATGISGIVPDFGEEQCLAETKQCIALQVDGVVSNTFNARYAINGTILTCGPPSGEDLVCDGTNILPQLSALPKGLKSQAIAAYCCESNMCNESLEKTIKFATLHSTFSSLLVTVGIALISTTC